VLPSRIKTYKEIWWWNQQVQEAVKIKQIAWKDLSKNNNHSTKELYIEEKTRAKKTGDSSSYLIVKYMSSWTQMRGKIVSTALQSI
jgi:hypothetical protein